MVEVCVSDGEVCEGEGKVIDRLVKMAAQGEVGEAWGEVVDGKVEGGAFEHKRAKRLREVINRKIEPLL
jgi:hypothetical protein